MQTSLQTPIVIEDAENILGFTSEECPPLQAACFPLGLKSPRKTYLIQPLVK